MRASGCITSTPAHAAHAVKYAVVLETATDVAKGMLHLHSMNVVHGDLKV